MLKIMTWSFKRGWSPVAHNDSFFLTAKPIHKHNFGSQGWSNSCWCWSLDCPRDIPRGMYMALRFLSSWSKINFAVYRHIIRIILNLKFLSVESVSSLALGNYASATQQAEQTSASRFLYSLFLYGFLMVYVFLLNSVGNCWFNIWPKSWCNIWSRIFDRSTF